VLVGTGYVILRGSLRVKEGKSLSMDLFEFNQWILLGKGVNI